MEAKIGISNILENMFQNVTRILEKDLPWDQAEIHLEKLSRGSMQKVTIRKVWGASLVLLPHTV